MLHEILLSLSGHSSPLLSTTATGATSSLILSPPEKALLASVAHLSDLHCKLLAHTAEISSKHRSSICQATALAIKFTHLANFQQKVLEVENGILRKDAASVGAYNIVPLTAIVGEFSDWTRRMEWLWDITQFMRKDSCTGAQIIDKLCDSVQTGYSDIEEIALYLVKIAETAWLKQASAWILYGRLPYSGKEDFFVQLGEDDDDAQDYLVIPALRPGFVSISAASSVLFIGRSLNHIRIKGSVLSNSSLGLVSSHLRLLSSLSFPITQANLSGVISNIRLSLSQNALEKLLPLTRISEILSLLHEYFLLGRGEYAVSLVTEADEKIRGRWRRSDNLAYEKRDRLGDVVVKDGEVAAVLARTWAAMSSMQGENDDEEQLELARDLVHFSLVKTSLPTLSKPNSLADSHTFKSLVQTPFNNLLFSIPCQLTLRIPSPLDLFLSVADVQVYSTINSYLISIRRAHLRLSDLWKITPLRRDHPAPPAPPYSSSAAGRAIVQKLRARAKDRSQKIRSVWATSSAALFFLGEAETYFHGEVIKGTWNGFQKWLTGAASRPASSSGNQMEEDVWTTAGTLPRAPTSSTRQPSHDPQTLSHAHQKCLDSLTKDLLLRTSSFTDPLYHLLQQIDHLVALVHRIHSIWQSLDLEADEGVVDAFSDFHKEEKDIEGQLNVIAGRVKDAIKVLIQSLREIDQEKDDRFDDGLDTTFDESAYVPPKVGRIYRLLMKLDFGAWFDVQKRSNDDNDYDSNNNEG